MLTPNNGLQDNRILAALSAIRGGPAAAPSRSVTLNAGECLSWPGVPLNSLYFPQSALISSVVDLSSGDSFDGVLIGCEGVFGSAAAFGTPMPVHSCVVRRGGTCTVMPASEARGLVHEHGAFAALLFRYQLFLLAQAGQNAACAAKHHIRERFCTRLLQLEGPTGEIRLTQEDLSRMLGVQRTSVSLVAGGLQADGLIGTHRGCIQILDRGGLLAAACECYSTIEAFKDTLLDGAEDGFAVLTAH